MTPEGKGFAHDAGDREAQQPGVSMLLTYLKSEEQVQAPRRQRAHNPALICNDTEVTETQPKEQGPLAITHILPHSTGVLMRPIHN